MKCANDLFIVVAYIAPHVHIEGKVEKNIRFDVWTRFVECCTFKI